LALARRTGARCQPRRHRPFGQKPLGVAARVAHPTRQQTDTLMNRVRASTTPNATARMSKTTRPSARPPVAKRGAINENPKDIGFLELLREDFQTHGQQWFEQGFWAVAVHRFGNWRMGVKPRLVRLPFSLLYAVIFKLVEWLCGITLPYTVRLGRRVRLWHHGGMILHAESIGDDVHIRHNTTFGVARIHHNEELPVIGNRVDIGCGACILGKVVVGDDAVIGANAVVIRDVPPGAVAGGVPARVLRAAAKPAAPRL